jgi:hypothetical protein
MTLPLDPWAVWWEQVTKACRVLEDDAAFVESMRAIVAHLDQLGELALKHAVEEDLRQDRRWAAMSKSPKGAQ